tara:strand:+ start:4406 stop:4993 length:588 start_codon:yes stop_codon:yes gene_type:complete
MMLPAIIQANNDNLSVPLIYIEVAILMFGAFMIGYFFAYYYQKSRYVKKVNLLRQKYSDKPENEAIELEDDLLEDEYEVAAERKTEIAKPEEDEALRTDLDFSRIGTASADDADNLQKIIGIGPYTEEKLNTIGIYTYDQISKFNARDIEIVTDLIHFFPDRIVNDNWVAKAKLLLQSKQRAQLRRDREVRMKKA